MGSRLIQLEEVIASERRCFYKVGKALREIRDSRLYREVFYTSFEAYVRERWDMGRSHAYRMIEASQVLDNLSPIGDTLPGNEAQLRPLGHLAASDQRRIWREFLTAGLALNAGNIRRFVEKHASEAKARIDLTKVIDAGYKAAVVAMLEQIDRARQEGWRSTSREAGLFWLRVMKEKISTKA